MKAGVSRTPTREQPFAARLPDGTRWYATAQQARQAKRSAWKAEKKRRTEKARAERRKKAEEEKTFWQSLHPNQQRAWRRIHRHLLRAPGSFTWRHIRKMFYDQERRCFYCQEPFPGTGKPGGSTFHIEHKRPVCQGGTNDPDNICLACPRCNLEKSGAGFHDYVRARRRRDMPAPTRSQQFPMLTASFRERPPRRGTAMQPPKDPWEAPTTFIRRRPERGKAVVRAIGSDAPMPPSRKAQAYREASTKAGQ